MPHLQLPNGNGGAYSAISGSGVMQRMELCEIQWAHFIRVDNALMRPADPMFVGACATLGVELGNKYVAKAFPTENVGVFRWKLDAQSAEGVAAARKYWITEYMEMTEEEVLIDIYYINNPCIHCSLIDTFAQKHRMIDTESGGVQRLAFSSASIVSHLFSLHFLRRCCERHSEIPYEIVSLKLALFETNYIDC
jgi:UDP-N-acetylglucosamine pyrophosphorylase